MDSAIMRNVEPILTKCGGLPKVIIALCRYLATNCKDLRLLGGGVDGFIDILQMSVESDGLRGLFIWMNSYFRCCSDFLKPCIFYLPIFPPNTNIRRRRFLRRWIAEGYSRSAVNATAEQNADESFEKLVGLSIIQWPPQAIRSDSRMTLCQINGFFHEYISTQPMEDNMVFTLEKQCSMGSQYTGRHLTVKRSWDRDMNVFESIDFSRLRSLTVFGEWRSFFVSRKMQLLRVLDVEDTTSDVSNDDLEQIAKLLSRLKFLSLRGCTSVSRLPTSLGNLKQLETLDVRHTSITMLPKAIKKLPKLQHIRAGSTPTTQSSSIQPAGSCWLPKFCRSQFVNAHLGVKVRRGIGELKALHTLGVVNVGASGGNVILKELKKLTQLRKLGVSGINRENMQDFYAAISAHGHLKSLSVRLEKGEQNAFCCVDDILSKKISEPLKETLTSLKLYGLLDKFPTWIKKLRSVQKLSLEMTILTQEMIDSLQSAVYPACLRLCVKPIQDGEHKFSFGHAPEFTFLQILEIACSSRLLLTFGEYGVDCLELLKVHSSSGSHISGLAKLKGLKQVWLVGSCDEALKKAVEHQLAAHPNDIKPVLKLEESSSR